MSSVISMARSMEALIVLVRGPRYTMMTRKTTASESSSMLRVTLPGAPRWPVFLISVTTPLMKDLFGPRATCMMTWLDSMWALLAIVEWLLLDLWTIGVDLLATVDLLMEVTLETTLLLLGTSRLVLMMIMLLSPRLEDGILTTVMDNECVLGLFPLLHLWIRRVGAAAWAPCSVLVRVPLCFLVMVLVRPVNSIAVYRYMVTT